MGDLLAPTIKADDHLAAACKMARMLALIIYAAPIAVVLVCGMLFVGSRLLRWVEPTPAARSTSIQSQ